MLFRLALRNISRNRRRSLMTASLIAMGALALLLFGGFTTNIFAGLETGIVQNSGTSDGLPLRLLPVRAGQSGRLWDRRS